VWLKHDLTEFQDVDIQSGQQTLELTTLTISIYHPIRPFLRPIRLVGAPASEEVLWRKSGAAPCDIHMGMWSTAEKSVYNVN